MNANLSVSCLLSIILHAIDSITRFLFFPFVSVCSSCRYRFSFTSIDALYVDEIDRGKEKEILTGKWI